MKREELQEELARVRKWTSYKDSAAKAAELAEAVILKHYDETQRELGYVQSLRSTISGLIEDNVTKDVRIQTLEAQLRAAWEHSGGDIEGDDE